MGMQPDELVATLRRLRMERGLSMARVAKKVGVSTGQISNVEMGHNGTTPDKLALWANALGYRLHLKLVPMGEAEGMGERVADAVNALNPDLAAMVADFATVLPRLSPREQRTWRAELQLLADELRSEDAATSRR